ncbi:GPI mannosyltransferase 2-like protein [Drosera capensis]
MGTRENKYMQNHTCRILLWAIASRITLLSLSVLWRSLLSPYDTSASLNPCCLSMNSSMSASIPNGSSAKQVLLPGIASFIEESIVWDSVYFIRIAECGYEYEQSYAFLPLLPISISLIANKVLHPLVPIIGHRALLALSGYVISNVAFVLATVYFYRLSVLVLKDPEAAMQASALFCFNPASIFYSSIYSESLYALFSFGGVYFLMSGANLLSVLWLALSGSARSNGVLNAGYFCFQSMHQLYDAIFVRKHPRMVLRILIAGASRCICIFIPFSVYQAFGYCNLCGGGDPVMVRTWCKARIPLLYSFIQSHYWGVGFLRYFQVKQLPNFLLATPILSLAVASIYSYVKSEPNKFLTLGFGTGYNEEGSARLLFTQDESKVPTFAASKRENQNLRKRSQKISALDADANTSPVDNDAPVKSRYYSVIMLPFLLHMGFMATTAFLVMHVQVATRFLSASPPLYWFASDLMGSLKTRRWAYLIWMYTVAYSLLGSLLFSNFYPFT